MNFRMIVASPIVALAFMAPSFGQDIDIGQREYMNSCAQCHGASGRGDGYLAGFLNSPTPDLTVLQRDNGGVFPVASVYAVIDGSAAAGVHGDREMPAWGNRYSVQAGRQLGREFLSDDSDTFVRGRILALIEYISTLQAE
ncbi:c-type cytochrome [Actibacterium lipolyticum]|uniref:Cytochrome c domain-containing protein n=1 Tax=Actibacterium lipolyticum TaxID=1524263 RepID=A0A238KG33_9RHOB|nr:c-type cytochrome [Actibacterium lipolyticum]SMX41819.1 hypothetical protein COL8621_01833 [Actibacterium lipolyticum]